MDQKKIGAFIAQCRKEKSLTQIQLAELLDVTSQVGIGTFVSTSNLDLLRDSKRRLVEQKMLDMIQTAKSLNISKDELNSMMDILYEED